VAVCTKTISIGFFEARLNQEENTGEQRQNVHEYSCNDDRELDGAFLRQRRRCKVEAVTGVFLSQKEGEHAIRKLQAGGLPADKITLLSLGLLGAPVLTEAGTRMGAIAGG
jgi:hypothetical protein